MSGIAGVGRPGDRESVERMVDRLSHRGPAGRLIIETGSATLGAVCADADVAAQDDFERECAVWHGLGNGQLAKAQDVGSELTLERDPLGVAPLYYGWEDGMLCFASEVKALIELTSDVRELPPGHCLNGGRLEPYFKLQEWETLAPVQATPQGVAHELRQRLQRSIRRRVEAQNDAGLGSWLSGGLDSSSLAALARPLVGTLPTFAAGMRGAPDLEKAREVAEYLDSDHHEVVVSVDDLLTCLPDVIYHLESFDALLVRSSLTNYLVAKAASDYVPAVLSGEGGDELFAGYGYLKELEADSLSAELIDITGRLHNTALQRVDRCASAHGTLAHVGFLDPEVAEYAFRIPTQYKLHQGVEKWILRRAVEDILPDSVLNRTKAKFWEGAGVGDLMAQRAEERISDADFTAERILPNGWILSTKEELMYYRIFREHFGELPSLSWLGRTKGAPVDLQGRVEPPPVSEPPRC